MKKPELYVVSLEVFLGRTRGFYSGFFPPNCPGNVLNFNLLASVAGGDGNAFVFLLTYLQLVSLHWED